MRPQQQNRRMRGRNNNNNSSNNSGNNNNNNRRGPNPLTRSYESNGPDVKIRGSAQQIAEKYATLARDAQSSGDRVVAENYLQHAEHYNRIIAAAQAQMPIQNFQQSRNDVDDDEDGDEFGAQQSGNGNGVQQHGNGGQPPQQQNVDTGSGPQPVIEGTPAEVALNSDAVSAEGEGANERQSHSNGNGNQQANTAEGEDGAPRRPRRPRRGRGRANADAEGGGEQGEAGGEVTVASTTPAQADAPSADNQAFESTEN